ncbi:MAG: hypothetical protein WA642_20775 [Steroidobacteraceae bacterium]
MNSRPAAVHKCSARAASWAPLGPQIPVNLPKHVLRRQQAERQIAGGIVDPCAPVLHLVTVA